MILEKLNNAKNALQETLKKILALNRTKKFISRTKSAPEQEKAIKTRLKLLNKMAAKQAKMVRLYERTLSQKKDTA